MKNIVPKGALSKSCIICKSYFFKGRTVSNKKWNKSRFCSVKCAHDGLLKSPRTVICLGCGIDFRRNTKDGCNPSYCSHECYAQNSDKTKKLNYNWKRHSKLIRKCKCGCGDIIQKYDGKGREISYSIGHQLIGTERPDARENLKKNRMAHRGEKHWNWQGGITEENKLIRSTKKYDNWRFKVYKRDHYTCQECNTHCDKYTIVAHHKKSFSKYPKLRFRVSNGITLCRSCHIKLHKRI